MWKSCTSCIHPGDPREANPPANLPANPPPANPPANLPANPPAADPPLHPPAHPPQPVNNNNNNSLCLQKAKLYAPFGNDASLIQKYLSYHILKHQ